MDGTRERVGGGGINKREWWKINRIILKFLFKNNSNKYDLSHQPFKKKYIVLCPYSK